MNSKYTSLDIPYINMGRLILILFLFINNNLFGQDTTQLDALNYEKVVVERDTIFTDAEPEKLNETFRFLNNKEFFLGIIVLVALLLILILLIYIVKLRDISGELSVKLILTTIVILSTLFLAVAGYDDRVIAPAFGLLGAILGYVFGRFDNKNT